MIPYEVIEVKEVMHEGFAELLADVSRLKDRIELAPHDEAHPVSIFQTELRMTFHGILGEHYNTMEDVEELKQKFARARATVRRLEGEYVGEVQRARD